MQTRVLEVAPHSATRPVLTVLEVLNASTWWSWGARGWAGCPQELVDQARHRWAMELLQRPGITMGQVSSELGFSDPRAFRRALKRWMQKPRTAASENER
jgi:AraC-like DNA-binding protein